MMKIKRMSNSQTLLEGKVETRIETRRTSVERKTFLNGEGGISTEGEDKRRER